MKKYCCPFISLLLVFCAGCQRVETVQLNSYTSVIHHAPQQKAVVHDADCWEKQAFDKVIEVRFSQEGVVTSDLPNGITVECKGANVSVESSLTGVDFSLSGESGNGSFKIISKEKFKITLNGVNLTSETRGVLNNQSSQPVFIDVREGTDNYLCDGIIYVKSTLESCKAAIYSLGKIVLSGKGGLEVKGMSKHAVCSEAGLLIRDGVNLSVSGAPGDGIRSKDRLAVEGGNIAVACAGDALDSKSGKIVVLGGNIALTTSGEKGHGISAGTDVVLFDGNFSIEVDGAAAKCIKSDSSLYIMGGNYALTSEGDGLFDVKKNGLSSSSCLKSSKDLYIRHANITAQSSGDGGKGISSDRFLQIDGGNISVTTKGNYFYNPKEDWDTSSPKAVKSDSTLVINGGNLKVLSLGQCEGSEGIESKHDIVLGGAPQIYVCSYDDAINSNQLIMNGGKVYAYSVRNDAVDVNSKMTICGGVMIANGSHSPEEGLDADFDGNMVVTGGTIFSIGGGMGGTPCMPANKATTQNSIAIGGVSLEKDAWMSLVDENGTALITYKLPRDLADGTLLVSSPLIKSGKSYVVGMGGDYTPGSGDGGDLYYNGVYEKGDTVASFAVSSLLTVVDGEGNVTHKDATEEGGNGFPGGGMPPMGGGFPPPPGGEGGMPQPQGGGPGGQNMPPMVNREALDSAFLAMFPDAVLPSKELQQAFDEGKILPDSFFKAMFPKGMPMGGPGMDFPQGGFPHGMQDDSVDVDNLPGGGGW